MFGKEISNISENESTNFFVKTKKITKQNIKNIPKQYTPFLYKHILQNKIEPKVSIN